MKRIFTLLLTLALLLSFDACSGTVPAPAETKETETAAAPVQKETETLPEETGTETETTTAETEPDPIPELTETALRALFDRNLTCALNIFELSPLYYTEDGAEGTLRKVMDPRFETYADLDAFVRETFVKETADKLLLEERMPGHTLYVNKDGQLYVDIAVIGGKGYYVDWSDYSLTITGQTGERCTFKVTSSVTYPAERPVSEPYEKEGEAVLQDGVWLLAGTIY